jgi:regulatory protein
VLGETGEGSDMNDESERLAPVTYLPWAAPTETPADSVVKHDDHPAQSIHDAESEVASPSHGSRSEERSGSRNGRSSTSGGGGGNRTGALASRRQARMSAVADDEAIETGAERDARIDRLVVSRLRRSALSVAEVRSVLAEHGLDESEIEEWIERYERLGYLDDARLAEQLVYVNGSRRGRGSGAIMQELSRRGVDAGAAQAAVGELDPEIERANALAVAERRARQLTGLDRQTAERRLSAFLQRRGYPGGVVREAVKAALSADGS